MAPPSGRTETINSRNSDCHSLYYTDPYTWARLQTDALRHKDFDAIDLQHVIEEIEDVGGRHEDRLLSQYARVMEHFLKLQYRHSKDVEPTRGWKNTIAEARSAIRTLLRRNPGLKSRRDELLADAWLDARSKAINAFARWQTSTLKDSIAADREDKRLTREWGLILPRDNPYTLHQVHTDFWHPKHKPLTRRPTRRDTAAPDHDWTR